MAKHADLNLCHIVKLRAQEQPKKRAFVFLEEGENETSSLTFEDLERQSRAIAVFLHAMKARGERAILLYPPGIEFIAAFLGCLRAGTIAVPASLPGIFQLKRSLERVKAIVKDARPVVVLTTKQVMATAHDVLTGAEELQTLRWLATDEIGGDAVPEWKELDIDGDELAFLQYTSGSTSVPKGVMVSHANLMHNIQYYHHGLGHTNDSVALTWMPTFHDLGIMEAVFQPLYGGFVSYLMPPAAFVHKPLRWLQAVTKYGVTHSSGPNFAFDLCVARISAEERSKLQLSSWQVAVIAAEPVRQSTIEKFIATFAAAGFSPTTLTPGYGLAETTLMVSRCKPAAKPSYLRVDTQALEQNRIIEVTSGASRTLAACGEPLEDPFRVKVVIADPEKRSCCDSQTVGEIWVSGPSVTKGYWNRPEETAETFQVYVSDTGEGPFLRTGDLGFLKDGQLYITGRLKDTIIIEGRNHYPQDIERTVEECHPALRLGCSAAFAIEINGCECLALAAEVSRNYVPLEKERPGKDLQSQASQTICLASKEVVRAIRSKVAEEHGVHVHSVLLLKAGTILKTSSGKIQRRACRQSFLNGGFAECCWDSLAQAAAV
jgi:acyl-CoA synthetase (AMP-forming)/AMP-acid ligase II